MKILFIRFSAIGDIVWTSPVVRCCKMQLPNAEIHFVTKLKFQDLVSSNPYIDKIFYLQDSILELLKALKNENYDYVIDLHNNLRSNVCKILLGKKYYTFNKLSINRFLYTRFQLKVMPVHIHVVDRMMDTVKKLNIVNDNARLDFFIESKNYVALGSWNIPTSFVVFVIGASKFTKKLPIHKMTELCLKINRTVVLIGGTEDVVASNMLVESLKKHSIEFEIFNLCGKLNLAQSASVVQQSELVFGHDTGLTHIAAAFGKKIYSIWGSTSSVGYAPYLADNVLIENNVLSCRPCSKSGRDKCPKVHFKCLNEISFEKLEL